MSNQWFFGTGLSMAPLISDQSLLEGEAIASGELRPGDIVVYCGPRRLVCHRVVLTRFGDGCWWYFLLGNDVLRADGWIPEYRIVARIVSVDGLPVSRWASRRSLLHALFLLYVVHKPFTTAMGRRLAAFRRRWISRRALVLPLVLRLTGGVQRSQA